MDKINFVVWMIFTFFGGMGVGTLALTMNKVIGAILFILYITLTAYFSYILSQAGVFFSMKRSDQ